ncbi:MAG: BglII/BstYI family type II restriction endonuclease [Sedimentisphaerales bacterium]
MIVAAKYSFNSGLEVVQDKYPALLNEITEIVQEVDAHKCKTKKSEEKTMTGRLLYNPVALNKAFKKHFLQRGWKSKRVKCEYSTEFYENEYQTQPLSPGAFREMDFIKEALGVEIQFGKYAFMVYNVCAKMTIFHNLGFVDTGVEIVPIKNFADEMSTGVSYFEQFIWDLEKRGVSNIDIPVLILGIDK